MSAMDKITIEGVRDFDPARTFCCGQCFRWYPSAGGAWTGLVGTRRVRVLFLPEKGGGGRLEITGAEPGQEAFWRRYFDLDRDYGEIERRLSDGDPVMEQAVRAGRGIRILRQDLWETIVSFLISQNNNIPRIQGCIERLCLEFGDPSDISANTDLSDREGQSDGSILQAAIPAPEVLAALEPEDLSEVRLGYRAKYLIGTARAVCRRGLPESGDDLLALPGVGPKVADCIRLFGMGEVDRFPVDVWIRRVMSRMYGLPDRTDSIRDFARERFGDLGGFAQQYLFYWQRNAGKNTAD